MLPSNYVRVDYIESHGNEYIDTGFKPNNNTKLELTFKIEEITEWDHPFGTCGGPSGSNRFFLIERSGSSSNWTLYLGTSIHSLNSVEFSNVKKAIFNDENHRFIYDNQIIQFTNNLFNSDYDLILFSATWYTGDISDVKTIQRIYNSKIYDNGTLIRDFIPVKNKNTNELGLYDLVNDTFYTNAGTGAFTYGQEMYENISLENSSIHFTIQDNVEMQANFKKKPSVKFLIGS